MSAELILALWDAQQARSYLETCGAPPIVHAFVARCLEGAQSITPLFVSMAAMAETPGLDVNLTMEPLSVDRSLSSKAVETTLYTRFVNHVIRHELGHVATDESAAELDSALARLCVMSEKLHRGRTRGPLFASTGRAESTPETRGINALLISAPGSSAQLVHASLVDYFCAAAVWKEALKPKRASIDATSILFAPSSYEINGFLRGFLKLSNSRDRKRAAQRLDALYERHTHAGPRLEIGDNDFLRNNAMYALGRLALLGTSVTDFEATYATEVHPLVKYTIGMNGILNGSLSLHEKIIRATTSPYSESERLVQEANLACHLYYYGDVPDIALPASTDWSLTRAGLARHFDPNAEPSYRAFWLIDLVTLVQLRQRFPPSDPRPADTTLQLMMDAISAIVGPSEPVRTRALQYARDAVGGFDA
jgi:hypothetical protein